MIRLKLEKRLQAWTTTAYGSFGRLSSRKRSAGHLRERPTSSLGRSQNDKDCAKLCSQHSLGSRLLQSFRAVPALVYLAVKEAMCVFQISVLPSTPTYSFALQNVLPSDGSRTIVL